MNRTRRNPNRRSFKSRGLPAKHASIASTSTGTPMCQRCCEPWPCVTVRGRSRYVRAEGDNAGRAGSALRPSAHPADAVLADLEKRGPSADRDVITRVYVEHDLETHEIRAAIRTLLINGALRLDGGKLVRETAGRRADRLTVSLGDVLKSREL